MFCFSWLRGMRSDLSSSTREGKVLTIGPPGSPYWVVFFFFFFNQRKSWLLKLAVRDLLLMEGLTVLHLSCGWSCLTVFCIYCSDSSLHACLKLLLCNVWPLLEVRVFVYLLIHILFLHEDPLMTQVSLISSFLSTLPSCYFLPWVLSSDCLIHADLLFCWQNLKL